VTGAGVVVCLLAIVANPRQYYRLAEDAEIHFRHAVNLRDDSSQTTLAKREFDRAAQQYSSLRAPVARRPGGLPSLEWTLGHVYYLSGDFPRAIAAYRRGLRLDPGSAGLETALAYARSRVEYPPSPAADLMHPERGFWPGWLDLHRLWLVAFAAYMVACVAVTRWRMTRRRLWFWLAIAIALIALVPTIGSGVEWLRRQRDDAAPVVVLSRSEMLRTGNGTDYTPRLDVALPRGAEVRRLFERGGWYQVELSGGPVGWLPREAVVEDN